MTPAHHLQAHLSRLGYAPGGLDGDIGKKTVKAMKAAGVPTDDLDAATTTLTRRVDAEGGSIPVLSPADFLAFSPKGRVSWLVGLNTFLTHAHITRERLPFALAQLAHESGGFKYPKELSPKPNAKYRPYIGRGPLQLTWESNYGAAGDYLGIDLVNNYTLVEQPLIGFLTAAWFWLHNNLNRYMPADGHPGDFQALTRAINGGLNGLSDREHWLEKAQSLFSEGGAQTEAPPPKPTILTPPPDRLSFVDHLSFLPSTDEPMSTSLRERFKTDGEVRQKVMAWIRERWDNRDRRRYVRKQIRALFDDDLDRWAGLYNRLLMDAMDGADTPEEIAEAEQEAYSSLRKRFFKSLEAKLVKAMDRRARWMFVGNEDWRAILEEHDGRLFQGLVSTVMAAIKITLNRTLLLTDKQADVINAEVASFLAEFASDEAPPSRHTPDRTRPPVIERAAPIPDAILDQAGDTVMELEDDPDTDESAAATVITTGPIDPADVPDLTAGMPSAVAAKKKLTLGSRVARQKKVLSATFASFGVKGE